jgi:hypothetical protein
MYTAGRSWYSPHEVGRTSVAHRRLRVRAAPSLLLLLLGLAGCASHIVECPGPAVPVRARISVARDPADPGLSRSLADLFTVKIGCQAADHDVLTGQTVWSYWVELASKQGQADPDRVALHLTRLDRQVTNFFDRRTGEDARRAAGGPLYLDAIRADLKVIPGPALVFPCAERLGAVPSASGRDPGGVYMVDRLYHGDVVVEKADGTPLRFLPAQVRFRVGFVLPSPAPVLPTAGAQEKARRQLRWARVTGTCETCRPVLVCESVTSRGPLDQAMPTFDASQVSELHVIAGVDRLPVVVDAVLAPRKRTIACTRWTPMVPDVDPRMIIRRVTDGTDEALPAETPFLTFHHTVTVAELQAGHRGLWKVELRLAETLDGWDGRPQDAPLCDAQDVTFDQLVSVP